MKKEMMKRIGMPSAKKPMEAEMEMEFEPADMEEEAPSEEMSMEEEAPEASSLLADVKDEDIMAELEARGYDVSMLAEPMSEEGEEELPEEESAPLPPKAKGKLPA